MQLCTVCCCLGFDLVWTPLRAEKRGGLKDLEAELTHMGVIFPYQDGILICFMVVRKDSGKFVYQPIWIQLGPNLRTFTNLVQFLDTF